MLAITVIILRFILMSLAGYNLTWAFPGVKGLLRGSISPIVFYLGFVFFANLTFEAYMIRHFVGPDAAPPTMWTMLLLCLSIFAAGIATTAHWIGATVKAKQLYLFYDALPQSIAIAELYRYDRAAAQALAEQARVLLVEKMCQQISEPIL